MNTQNIIKFSDSGIHCSKIIAILSYCLLEFRCGKRAEMALRFLCRASTLSVRLANISRRRPTWLAAGHAVYVHTRRAPCRPSQRTVSMSFTCLCIRDNVAVVNLCLVCLGRFCSNKKVTCPEFFLF